MFRLLLLLPLVWLTACTKCAEPPASRCDLEGAYAGNPSKVTIAAGVWGTASQMSGNCMPIVGPGSTCSHCPVSRTIRFYAYTHQSQAVRDPAQPSFYQPFTAPLIREVNTDSEGFFQAALPPGTYTMVMVQNGLLYAPGLDGQGGINPVTVPATGVVKANFINRFGAVF